MARVMICQSCHKEQAMVHIHGTGTSTAKRSSPAESSSQEFELHFCEACAEEYRRAQASHSLFPHLREEHRTEVVRVMSRTPERTVLRLVRTAEAKVPEEWTLLTSRLPDRLQVGREITISFTPAELEWMKGERELGT